MILIQVFYQISQLLKLENHLHQHYHLTNTILYFRNALFNPHSGHNATAGGILSSTGFKVRW